MLESFSTIDRDSRATVSTAQDSPYDRLQQLEVVNCLTQGLAVIRAVYYGKSTTAALEDEAACLVDDVRRIDAADVRDYVVQVDDLWTHWSTLWGPTQVSSLCEAGKLDPFLPAFVQRLSPHLRDRVLQFYSDVVRQTMDDTVLQHLPLSLRTAMQRAFADHEAPLASEEPYTFGFYFNAKRHGEVCDPGEASAQYEGYRTAHLSTSRLFTTPDDLRRIASALLLEPYWRPLVQRLLSGCREVSPGGA